MVLKNNKGQLMLVGLMMMIFLIFAAVVLIEPLKEAIGIGRESLDCGNPAIATMEKATCILVSGILPYFIGIVLAASAAYLFLKASGSSN
jgi:hypothetical protein